MAEPEGMNRRRFLLGGIGFISTVVALVLGIPFVAFLLGPDRSPKKGKFVKVANLDSIPLGRPVRLKFVAPGRNAYIDTQATQDVWVLRKSDSEVVAYSAICPHLGCHYDWSSDTNQFICPCHGSIFDVDGRVLGGPSPRPLDTLTVRVESGMLSVIWERFKIGVRRKIVV